MLADAGWSQKAGRAQPSGRQVREAVRTVEEVEVRAGARAEHRGAAREESENKPKGDLLLGPGQFWRRCREEAMD